MVIYMEYDHSLNKANRPRSIKHFYVISPKSMLSDWIIFNSLKFSTNQISYILDWFQKNVSLI